MIGALRKLLRREGRVKLPRAAPLGDSLLLVVSRWRSIEVGRLRASASLGRYKVAVRELGEGDSPPSRVSELPALLDELAPRLDEEKRTQLLEFVLEATLGDLEKPGAVSLATSLRLLRERLRERLPELLNELTSGLVVIVDAVVALDPRSFWIGGWCVDADGSLGNLEAISPEGQRIKLLEGAYRYHRADVEESLSSVGIRTGEKHGFAKYVELPLPSPLNLGWLSRLEKPRTGSGFELPMPAVTRDPDAAYGRILGELSTERTDSDELRRDHARPSLLALQRQMVASVAVARETQHGTPPEDPAVSIVVPLYERIDLIEHQLAHFWRDPDFHAAELIYVLDSPNLSESLGRLAGPLHELYGIPFKVLELNRNSGYSTANNVGFAHSRGRLLLLLNSDVLPVEPTAGCRGFDPSTRPPLRWARSARSCSTRTTRSSTPACTSSATPTPATGRTSTTSRASAARLRPPT